MKKIQLNYLTLLLALLFSCAGTAMAIELVNPSFELPGTAKIVGWDGTGAAGSSTEDIPGWNSDSDASDSGVEAPSDTAGVTDGTYRGFLMSSDDSVWQTTSYTIAEGDIFSLSVDALDTWNGGTFVISLYYVDGTDRVTIDSLTYTLTDTMATVTLETIIESGSAADGNLLGVEIDHATSSDGNSGWCGFDNVVLEKVLVVPVSPLNGEELVDIDGSLQWSVAGGYDVDVYFTNDPNLAVAAEAKFQKVSREAVTELAYTELAYYDTYYWRVDVYEPNSALPNDFNLVEGDVWTFVTKAQQPLVSKKLSGVTAAVGGSADMVLTASDVEFVNWFKVVGEQDGDDAPVDDPADDPITIDGVKYESAIDPADDLFDVTFTVNDVTLEDEGKYYGVLGNTATEVTTRSAVAELLTARLMGWWELNNSLADSVSTAVSGATGTTGELRVCTDGTLATTTASYATGNIDKALVLNDINYVAMTGTETSFDFYTRGMTLAVWVKTSDTGWGAVASKAVRNSTGWVLQHEGNTMHMTFRGISTASVSAQAADGLWHLIVCTYDQEAGVSAIYASIVDDNDMLRLNYSSTESSAPALASDQPFMIGYEIDPEFGDPFPFTGSIEDVKVYSYAMSGPEIAEKLYYPVVQADFCMVSEIGDEGSLDYNDDCQINVLDMANFAQFWLECNMYPACQ